MDGAIAGRIGEEGDHLTDGGLNAGEFDVVIDVQGHLHVALGRDGAGIGGGHEIPDGRGSEVLLASRADDGLIDETTSPIGVATLLLHLDLLLRLSVGGGFGGDLEEDGLAAAVVDEEAASKVVLGSKGKHVDRSRDASIHQSDPTVGEFVDPVTSSADGVSLSFGADLLVLEADVKEIRVQREVGGGSLGYEHGSQKLLVIEFLTVSVRAVEAINGDRDLEGSVREIGSDDGIGSRSGIGDESVLDGCGRSVEEPLALG